jgi:Na+(H+)/acetate symporter ActP
VAWLVALLLVAELMRNSGRFTMADLLTFAAGAEERRGTGSAAGTFTAVPPPT